MFNKYHIWYIIYEYLTLSHESAAVLLNPINAFRPTYYTGQPTTHPTDVPVDAKQAVNTNKGRKHLERHDGQLLITSVIDNRTRSASVQTMQNVNLIFGCPKTRDQD